MHRTTYNFASFSTNPRQVEDFLKRHVPGFKPVVYKPDFRQGIAQSWPAVLDKDTMIKEIGIEYEYDFERAFVQLIEDIKQHGPN